MRKQVYGRKFKRDRNERKALFAGLISAMILKGRINTTEEKAKAIRGELEKLVTKAKKQKKELLQKNLKPFEVDKIINEIAPTFEDRNGGYTRIIKTGRRLSDNASMAILEWSETIVRKPATTASNAASRSLAKTPASAKATAGKQKKVKSQTRAVRKKARATSKKGNK